MSTTIPTKQPQNHKLTPKQERFAQLVAAGATQIQAYRDAGYSFNNASLNGLYVNASALANNTKVALRITQLRAPSARPAEASIAERREVLASIIRDDHRTPLTAKEKIYAIAELNKLDGSYPAEKHAILKDVRISVVYENRTGGASTPKPQPQQQITEAACGELGRTEPQQIAEVIEASPGGECIQIEGGE